MNRMPEAASSIEPSGNIAHLIPGTLRSFADIVERFPFREGTTFGAIGKPERPIAYGYTPAQLAGVLRRLDGELEKGRESKIFDKSHWQLAALEAVETMSGPLAEPVQKVFDAETAALREKVTEQRLGFPPPLLIDRKQTEKEPARKNQSAAEREVRGALTKAFFERAREFTVAHKNPKVWAAEAILVATAACSGGGSITPSPSEIPTVSTGPAITETVPALFPTATDIYHFGTGGAISPEKLAQMEAQDPTVSTQIAWLQEWGDWYGSADASIRPMTAEEARTNIVFYEWTDTNGNTHFKAAWKFDAGYPGYILTPPAVNWEDLNPPVASAPGHEIGPGQGPVEISIECAEGSVLAGLGVPVGAILAAEQGTGDWVMIFDDAVVARISREGIWQMPIPYENGPSMEFSPLFPAEWHSEWTGSVAAMDIPIIIGLSSGVVHDTTPPLTPITGVWMTQEGADAVADAFLRAAHYRYTEIMGNTITYEDYLTLLKTQPRGGEVNLLIMDNDGVTRREALIDPRQGFSTLWTDRIDRSIGLKWNSTTYGFFGVDGQGRLLHAFDHFSHFDFSIRHVVNGISVINYDFIFNNIRGVTDFGWIENKCMTYGTILGTCGNPRVPPVNSEWWKILVDLETKFMNGQGSLVWGLEKP